ncbi:leucine-rich repeat domain-containing protein [Fibrella sp. WM1]|uniref:leucine-rich repeat domain-containing protein n=1 Tax=Fibrella musci TaxID=3242485 RepID=UPI003521868F
MNNLVKIKIEQAINDNSHILDLSHMHLEKIDFLEYMDYDLSSINFLSISNNNLKNIPNSIARFKNLVQLIINDNELIEFPEYLYTMRSLREIDASSNKLTYISKGLARLTRLSELDLSHNLLESLPTNMERLSLLYNLNLHGNKLVDIPPALFRMNNLGVLNLSNNKIERLPVKLGDKSRIFDLDLSDNFLCDLPEDFSGLKVLRNLNLSNNKLESIPNSIYELTYLSDLDLEKNKLTHIDSKIDNLKNLQDLNLDYNQIKSLPPSIGNLKELLSLSISNNNLTNVPDSVCGLSTLINFNLGYNHLAELPANLKNLGNLGTFNLRGNRLESEIEQIRELNNPDLMMDYRDNPFLEKALMRLYKFTKIWSDIPMHLREIIKVYFSGFNIFYSQRTQTYIEFNVTNTNDGLSFEIEVNETVDPNTVDNLLSEYYGILKEKIREGAETGVVYPRSSDDPADFFAQVQATNFAQNASIVKFRVKENISDKDILNLINFTIDKMESDFRCALRTISKQLTEGQEYKRSHALLQGKIEAQNEELTSRRIEANVRASQPINISVTQTQSVHIQHDSGDTLSEIRRLLDPYISDFQRREGADLQKEVDNVSEKVEIPQSEKKSIGKRLKRWLENVKEATKTAKEAGAVGSDAIESFNKLKDYATNVLADPSVIEAIDNIKQAFESAS